MPTPWCDRYARRTQGMTSSAIREILKLTQQPEVISFAGGLPAPELFPTREVEEAACRVLRERGAQALQYSITEGYPPLREFIVQKMARYGIEAALENVLITSGSQQGLDLIGKVLVDPGDRVIVEAPTYLGALQAWRPYEPEFISVPIDDDGMRVELLQPVLERERPKMIYALPNFQNPAGTTLSQPRRELLAALCEAYGVPVIEDDPYGELRYSGDHLPPIVVLDAKRLKMAGKAEPNGYLRGNVIYMSTFSKTLAPGLRLGWVVAPVEVIRRLVQAKQGADLHTSTFVQMVAYEVVKDGFLDAHVRQIREVYRIRRDAMLEAMAEFFPEGVEWTRPEGGLFLWVRLPEGMDAVELLHEAVQQKVAFVPGYSFYADERGRNTLRLNFSNAEPELIREGIRRLGRTIERHMETLKVLA